MGEVSVSVEKAAAQLAEFVAQTQFSDFSREIVERAKLITADTIGVAIRGAMEPEMQQLYQRLPKGHGASLFKEGFQEVDPAWAAFANATAACFLELDEGSRPTGHPALHVLPSAFALSQEMNKSGADFLTAFILGYEVQYRIQQATKLRKIVHPHGNFGHAGAIAAIGKLLGWDAEKINEGLNAAVALAMATSWQPCLTGATVRNSYPGMTAQTAFTVRMLIESGFTGYKGALGETFGQILGESFHGAALTEQLGSRYGLLENYFKFHAACALVHPVLDALAGALGGLLDRGKYPPLKVGQRPNPESIKRIRVKVAENAFRLNVLAYPNQLSAKFSIPYAVSVFVTEGSAHFNNFRGDFLCDPRIQSLSERVVVETDPELTAKWPKEAHAEVTIELEDGRVLSGRCSNPFGSAANPPSPEDVSAKFDALAGAVLRESGADSLWEKLLHLEEQEDMASFFSEFRFNEFGGVSECGTI